ncbi:MAG TPA: hypothetical protein VEJ21_01925 [Acidimicrobiales bacterium]|nr:hypothetical protein [Acidimicrobiales bacterium]
MPPPGAGAAAEEADRRLAQIGAQLADAVIATVPAWVEHSVVRVLDAFDAAGSRLDSEGDRAEALARARRAGEEASAELAGPLQHLLASDVDDQWTTPLVLVRQLVAFPTAVLAGAGVPPVERDRFAEQHFPDDRYGLTPASLAVLGEGPADLALAWGAAKAAAHRARHRRPSRSPGDGP